MMHLERGQRRLQTFGAAIDVRRILGPGLLESEYEEARCVYVKD